MKNKELETWLAETKAKNLSKEEIELEIHKAPFKISRILLDNGNNLAEKAKLLFNQWQKETDFKSQVIELIESEINVWQKNFEASVKDEDFQSCSVNFIAKMACEKILNKTKQL